MKIQELRFESGAGEVSAVWQRPEAARFALVLAHGAGADMHHAFLPAAAGRLADEGGATLRFQFPYSERGSRRPDPAKRLIACGRSAGARARELAGGLPLLAGGKSMGGRMTSLAAAETPLEGVAGLVFFGFPLHPAGREEKAEERGAHLARVGLPMLFLPGDRDRLADLALLRPRLPEGATLHVVEHADHGFHVTKRSGRSDAEVLAELAAGTRAFAEGLSPR